MTTALSYAIYTSHSKRGSQVHKFNLMKRFWCLALLLVCTCTHTPAQQGGCNNLSTTNGLITGRNRNGVIPIIRAPPRGKYTIFIIKLTFVVAVLRSQVGGNFVSPWSLFSATQVRQHGLWCQVNSASNAGMGSNIGDMFYSTGDGPDGFTVVPTSDPSNNVSYQQLKCTNQIGVIVDGDTTYFQGFLKCNTTIPNLDINTHYWVMYSDTVFDGYCKMHLSGSYAYIH